MKTIILAILFILTACVTHTPTTPKKEVSFYPCQEEIFWKAVCYAESGCKTDASMVEPLNPATISAGLYQLSMGAGPQYGCDFKTFQDILDPKKNTDCKDKIAKRLRELYPNEKWNESLARYWGVMRSRANPMWAEYHRRYKAKTGRDHNGYENLQYYAKKFGCIIL